MEVVAAVVGASVIEVGASAIVLATSVAVV